MPKIITDEIQICYRIPEQDELSYSAAEKLSFSLYAMDFAFPNEKQFTYAPVPVAVQSAGFYADGKGVFTVLPPQYIVGTAEDRSGGWVYIG